MSKRAAVDDDAVIPAAKITTSVLPGNLVAYTRLASLVAAARASDAPVHEIVAAHLDTDEHDTRVFAHMKLNGRFSSPDWHGYVLLPMAEWAKFEQKYVRGDGEFCLFDLFGKHSNVHAQWKDFTVEVARTPLDIALMIERAEAGDWNALDEDSHYDLHDD